MRFAEASATFQRQWTSFCGVWHGLKRPELRFFFPDFVGAPIRDNKTSLDAADPYYVCNQHRRPFHQGRAGFLRTT